MEILNSILQMSAAGSILFIIIFIFKPFTNKIFSATWTYYMLVLTLLFFIIPIRTFVKLPEATFCKDNIFTQSTSNLLHINKQNLSQEDYEKNNYDIIDNHITNNNESEFKSSSEVKNSLENLKIIPRIFNEEMLLYVWMLGAIIFLCKEIYIYIYFYKKLKSASSIIEDVSIITSLETCKKKLNINGKIVLKECPVIKSPMITGIFAPVITIPKMNQNLDKLQIVLTHELIHYKRKDLLIKIIALIANVINWFNPIVYIVRSKINLICELSLD